MDRIGQRVQRLKKVLTTADIDDLSGRNSALMALAFRTERFLWARDGQGRTLLHEAADAGNSGACQRIVDHDPFTVYALDEIGRGPLHCAVGSSEMNVECVRLLATTHVMGPCRGVFELAVHRWLSRECPLTIPLLLTRHWTEDSLLAVMAVCHVTQDWGLFMEYAVTTDHSFAEDM